MEKYMTAKSYRDMKWDGEPFEQNGKMYVKVIGVCPRCGGQGRVSHWSHIDAGICYQCRGSGKTRETVRLYTEKEIAAQEMAAERKAMKKKEEAEANSEINKKNCMKKFGFSEDGLVWCVFGDNTYDIKEWLKEQGCRFDPLLKWHCDHHIELPAGYGMFSISFDDLFTWDMYSKRADYREDAREVIDRKYAENEEPSTSEYVGEVGERLRNLTAIYKSSRGFNGIYGYTNIYTFESEGNCLVWFTTKELNLEKGAVIDLTATVKKHEEFRGVKTTQLSRAIIKEVQ